MTADVKRSRQPPNLKYEIDPKKRNLILCVRELICPDPTNIRSNALKAHMYMRAFEPTKNLNRIMTRVRSKDALYPWLPDSRSSLWLQGQQMAKCIFEKGDTTDSNNHVWAPGQQCRCDFPWPVTIDLLDCEPSMRLKHQAPPRPVTST